MSTRRDRAEEIMREAHVGQTRKDGVTPYIEHPVEVAKILEGQGEPEEVVLAGLLHDVIEDGDDNVKWMNRIRDEVGEDVLMLVMWVSDSWGTAKPPGNRAVRKVWQREKLRLAPREARALKLADMLSNLSATEDLEEKFLPVFVAEMEKLLLAIGASASNTLWILVDGEIAGVRKRLGVGRRL